jgi:hypothetical protein
MVYIIQKINIDEVDYYDTRKFNTNNHWENNVKPLDYNDKLKLTYAPYWIDHFKTYKKFTIDLIKHSWIKDANKLCSMTGKFSHHYDDDLNNFLNDDDNKHIHKLFDDNNVFFVRTNNVSLKYSMHKCGPYNNLKMIMESLVSCIDGHTPIYDYTTELDIYLIPWQNLNENKEFRIFVYKNRITAISQQNIYSSNNFLLDDNVDENYNIIINDDNKKTITNWIDIINNYFVNNIRPKITHIDNYTIDLCILDYNTPYFIELNSFGKEYAAGSALFHWIYDENILLNDTNDDIYFRYD